MASWSQTTKVKLETAKSSELQELLGELATSHSTVATAAHLIPERYFRRYLTEVVESLPDDPLAFAARRRPTRAQFLELLPIVEGTRAVSWSTRSKWVKVAARSKRCLECARSWVVASSVDELYDPTGAAIGLVSVLAVDNSVASRKALKSWLDAATKDERLRKGLGRIVRRANPKATELLAALDA